jgi:arsenate reductase
MEVKNTILFVCTGNSCRSQMAEGFMKELLNTDHKILSAGLKPSTVNPVAIKAMKEKNIDISRQTSNHVDEFLNYKHDYVITVCDNAKKLCPAGLDANNFLHWSIPDPYVDGKDNDLHLPRYRKARDLIKSHIETLLFKILN